MKNIKLTFLLLSLFWSLQGYAQYQKPTLTDKDSWSLVLLPDPQTYSRYHRNGGILNLMTSWIYENVEALNMQFVLCTGDLVEQNDFMNPQGNTGNMNSQQQWSFVRSAFSKFDNHVPYVLATGNHDYGYKSAEYRSTNYDKYFSVEQNSMNFRALREIGPALNGASTSVNALYEFKTPQNKNILVMVLEFGPRDTVVNWAKDVLNNKKYVDKDVILLTHVFLNKNSNHIKTQKYKMEDVNYGEALFEKLVKPSKNIRLVFSGHIGDPDVFDGHLGFRQDKNMSGKTVTQMTFNAQAMGGGWHGNGGDGWLRYLEFLPDGNTVKVKTFSPLFAISPATQSMAYKTEANQEFTFTLN
ncbi:serine/threonine protein phosphatase [Sphingobacterium psychroaquaticum]|uniref:metallophosphoesterase n=1 Tax=Sphingobacterium psychroaquaticum TaxID=561061 RepID=UPI00106A77C7|nr:metallophosphoesterase [Sphingobacterium psychroaquaticum]QBQ42327.1 serine/threonine protein phosphatase [Sphingobacterium psychroaquaticum]